MNPSSAVTNIKMNLSGLSASERQVADFVMSNIGDIPDMSLADVAEGVGVSDTTVMRFTRSIEFDGFSAFKVALVADLYQPDEEILTKITEEDSCVEIA